MVDNGFGEVLAVEVSAVPGLENIDDCLVLLHGRGITKRCHWLDTLFRQDFLEARNDTAMILGHHLTMLLDFRCGAAGNSEFSLFHVELIGLNVNVGNLPVCKFGSACYVGIFRRAALALTMKHRLKIATVDLRMFVLHLNGLTDAGSLFMDGAWGWD